MSKVAVTHFLDYFFPFISPLWAFLSYTVCLQSIHFVYFDANVLCYEDIFVWFLFLSSRTASPNNKWLTNIDYYWKAIGLYFLFTAKIITRRKPLVNLDPVFIRFFLLIFQQFETSWNEVQRLRMHDSVREVFSLSHWNKNFLRRDNTSRRIGISRLLAIAIHSFVAFYFG